MHPREDLRQGRWNDKPILAISDNGNDVYVSWNGPQSGDPYVAQSHNGGTTWTQTKVVERTRYFFAFDGDVLANGTVVFSETSLDYGGPGGSLVGQAQVNVLRSTNNGASFTANLVDTVELGTRLHRRRLPSRLLSGTQRDHR